MSCNFDKNQKKETIDNVVSIIEIENSETKVDTSFLDFFENFMWDKEFQKSRVIYPIEHEGIEFKSLKEWQYLPFYAQSKYMPILTSDTLIIFDQDLRLKSIEIYIVDFKKNSAACYAFEKVQTKWHLKRSKDFVFKNLPDIEFIDFLTKFSNDSLFQIKSVSFPLLESYSDAENQYETALNTIKLDDWKFWKLTDDINQLMILSNIQMENKYRNIFFRGLDNGRWVKLTFEKINGSWKLMRLEDYST
jgi:hypothetical protein